MKLNLVRLLEKLGADIRSADLGRVDLTPLTELNLNAIELTAAELSEILINGFFTLSLAQQRSVTSLAQIAKSISDDLIVAPSGVAAAGALDKAFASEAGQFGIASIKARAARAGVQEDLVNNLLTAVFNDLGKRLEQKSLLDLNGGPIPSLEFQLVHENIGTLAIAGLPASLLLAQAGPSILLTQDRSAIDPESDLGQAIIIVDMLIEILGVFLLFVNVVIPKVNWAKIIDVLSERRAWTAFESIADALASLAAAVANSAGNDEILRLAKKALSLALGTDTFWEVIEAGLDLPWYEWLKLGCTVILLTTLDVLSGGIAIAAKVALAVVFIYEIVGKAQKLRGEDPPLRLESMS